MNSKFREMLGPDQVHSLTRPRSLGECQLFRKITEHWHREDNHHRPSVPVYGTIETGWHPDQETSDDTIREPVMHRVDFRGLVEPPFVSECKTISDYRFLGKWKSTPYEVDDNEVVFVARATPQPNAPASQVERFEMLLGTHCMCTTSDLEPFKASDVAESLATMWATWGCEDFNEEGVSVGALLLAAHVCGIRVRAENRGFMQNAELEKRFGRSLDGILVMLRKDWFADPEKFSMIENDGDGDEHYDPEPFQWN